MNKVLFRILINKVFCLVLSLFLLSNKSLITKPCVSYLIRDINMDTLIQLITLFFVDRPFDISLLALFLFLWGGGETKEFQ